MKRILSFLLFLLSLTLGAQSYAPEDSLRLTELLLLLPSEAPASRTLCQAALLQRETPYVANLLCMADEPEQLRLPVVRTDCILFVETLLAVTRTVRKRGDFSDFRSYILQSRYREAAPNSYLDRIHYTTEWIRRLEAAGVLEDLTLSLGGEIYPHPIHYMSDHPAAYHLRPEDLPRIRAIEQDLNRTPMTYIPKARIADLSGAVKDGDILCFVTSIAGLDISHVAIAYGNGFIHASQVAGKVLVDPLSLVRYAASRKSCVGIKVLRIKD